jgi:E3 ubiquitin-protein ligase MYCBP2
LFLIVQNASDKDPNRQSQRWNSLEIAHGSYSSDDCINDIAELKFEKPVPIKSHVKYALRMRNHGGRTSNGDAGVSSIKGPDGTVFSFSSCSLSMNGTNPTRGQLPQLLYFNSPQENDVQSSTKSLAELYSRRTALSMTATIVKTLTNLLIAARDSVDEKGLEILNSAPIITKMMPHVLASIANLTKSDPHSAVQIIAYIQDLLPSVAALNNSVSLQGGKSDDIEDEEDELPSPHYAWVESEHPYKSASVSNYRVSFPSTVHWMSIEFDPRCATAQMEDVVQIYIKSPGNNGTNKVTKTTVTSGAGNRNGPDASSQQEMYIPVLKKFYGTSNWPKQAVILPGNEMLFSLETASDYVRDEKVNSSGNRQI